MIDFHNHIIPGVDDGPKTIEIIKNEISDAKTIFWNGPAGVFETKPLIKEQLQ